ncbi:putative transposase [Haloferula luteola]|uniref:Putative transposase n=1 Tax=Haloferula luteola TaxID=595692 RepID=A0A840V8H2_9BACT|nr:transposase [Haloferula luteola]MBB5350250.1 putative transposase [Haloferula luteola]
MNSWPHAPPHWNHEPGIYFVTASTYRREFYFHGKDRLDLLQFHLLTVLQASGWRLDAWAIFPNHYHLVLRSHSESVRLSRVLGKIHMLTAREINRLDSTPGKKRWHNYRDSRLTFERSYLARLRYVMHNPVHHGYATHPTLYRWCSGSWFSQTASPAFLKTVESFPIDRLKLEDDE